MHGNLLFLWGWRRDTKRSLLRYSYEKEALNYFVFLFGCNFVKKCPGMNVFDPLTKRCVPLSVASCNGKTNSTNNHFLKFNSIVSL